MPVAPALRNRHPADLLADVRAEIRQLKIYEAELRQELLADGADLTGVQFKAIVSRYGRTRETADIKGLIKHFGEAAVRPFIQTTDYQVVLLRVRPRRQVRDVIRNPVSASKGGMFNDCDR